MRMFAKWDEATWVCSIKGHVTPAAIVAKVDERELNSGLPHGHGQAEDLAALFCLPGRALAADGIR